MYLLETMATTVHSYWVTTTFHYMSKLTIKDTASLSLSSTVVQLLYSTAIWWTWRTWRSRPTRRQASLAPFNWAERFDEIVLHPPLLKQHYFLYLLAVSSNDERVCHQQIGLDSAQLKEPVSQASTVIGGMKYDANELIRTECKTQCQQLSLLVTSESCVVLVVPQTVEVAVLQLNATSNTIEIVHQFGYGIIGDSNPCRCVLHTYLYSSHHSSHD